MFSIVNALLVVFCLAVIAKVMHARNTGEDAQS